MIPVPEGHGKRAEVPQDRPKGGRQPLRAEDDVVAGERECEEVNGELFTGDGEGDGAVDTGARHTFVIGQ